MTTFVYHSGETGAPVLTNVAGAVAAILDAVLINGFNTVTGVTVTRTGSVATFTKTAHGFGTAGGSNDQNAGVILTVAGFTQTEYNITGPASNITANTWDMTVSGTPATPGTTSGTTSALRAPMKYSGTAWTTAFTAANKRAYRQPASVSSGFYLNVDDSRVRSSAQCDFLGFETMSALATGTGQFPTALQAVSFSSAGVLTMACSAAGSNRWLVVGNGRMFHLVLWSANAQYPSVLMFGDAKSVRAGDLYNCLLIGDPQNTASAASGSSITSSQTNAIGGHYIARGYSQAGQAFNIAKTVIGCMPKETQGAPVFPNPADGGLYFMPWSILENWGSLVIRGTIPGFWTWIHAAGYAKLGDTFSSGSGALSGRTFEALSDGVTSLFVETSDTWDI